MIFICRVDDLLHAVHIRSKRRDDQSCILMLRKNMIECDTHRSLRLCKSFSLRICTIRHQRKYAFLSNLGKSLQIDGITEYRRIIHFEVPGMHDYSCWRIDRQCRRILNAVVCLDKFDPELTQINRLSVLNNLASCTAQKIMFF